MEFDGKLVVISGFSGSGKGTVIRKLRGMTDDHVLSVSMTTGAPRDGEVEGEDYFYVTDERFEEEIKREGFLEYAGYVNHYYGTPRAYVEEKRRGGFNVLLEIEVQGAVQIRNKIPDSMLIFLITPSAAELERRLSGRESESPEVVTKRLKQALEEAKYIPDYDYMLINEDVTASAMTLDRLIRYAPDDCRPDAAFVNRFVKDLEKIIEAREAGKLS